jgi:hypothetical protein
MEGSVGDEMMNSFGKGAKEKDIEAHNLSNTTSF